MSNTAFKANFAKLLKKAGDDAGLVVRKTALQLQTSMVAMSPVDTGRFKGNWQPGIGAINADTSAGEDRTGAGVIGRTVSALGAWKPGQMIYLTNSLPYARRLEFGWSKQAPGGMVRLTVANYARTLAEAVRSIK